MTEGAVITAVVPALNEEPFIGNVVAELLRSPHVRSVIVVDNGSTDRTAQIARAAGAKVIYEPVRGMGNALKAGLRATDSQWVLKIDGDIRNPDLNWIESAAHAVCLDSNIGIVKSYWSHSIAGWPETYFMIKPMLRIIDPILASVRMPISGIFLFDLTLLDIDSLRSDWSIDLEILCKVRLRGRLIHELKMDDVIHTERDLSFYFKMADELLSYLLEVSRTRNGHRITWFCAHPDDAIIWSGGTLLQHLMLGGAADIFVFFGSDHGKLELHKIQKTFKNLEIHYTSLRPRAVIDESFVIMIRDYLLTAKPVDIVTHHPGDMHPDHREVASCVASGLLFIPSEKLSPGVFYLNSYYNSQNNRISFRPNTYVDITSVSEVKYKMIEVFDSEDIDHWVQMSNLMDSLNGLKCAVHRAEAFEKAADVYFTSASTSIVPFFSRRTLSQNLEN